MHVAVGEGHVSPQSVVARLARELSTAAEEEVEDVPLARPVQIKREASQGVVVPGGTDVWVRLARCCMPVPGDQIIGFVSRGQGVSVHRADCPNAKALAREPERLLEVSWREGRATSFVVAIQVEALDRTKLLGDVATALAEHGVSILSATTSVSRDRISMLRFTFEIADITHLSRIISAVKGVENVFDAFRIVPR
jgi:guanosine-3',5'-bis(diphosphate) 3'-pyrophosphohydrolase